MASDALGLLGGQQYFAFRVTDTHKDTDTHTQRHRHTKTQRHTNADPINGPWPFECPFPQYFALLVTPPDQDWDIIIERASQWELRLIV